MLVKAGDTNVTTYFAMRKTLDGTAATGLTPADFDLQYVRSGAVPVAKVDMVALAATNTAHTDNRGIEIDATDQPGIYRIDWPDAAFATGVREVILSVKVATAFTEHLRAELNAPVDAVAISGDTTAADNLELQYDITGLTGPTFPATQSQVGNIGSASGGALSFQAETDNAITDTIDNAAAVDKGSGLVGIPVTGHAFTVDYQVTIAGSTNYNGSFTIISETTNEVVITASFVSETFGGSETIISTIKTIAKVGTETGTFANTEAEDGTYHVLTNAGDNLDWVYQIDVGGGRAASLIHFHGYLTSNNDTVNIQAYDFVGSDWETRAILQGTSQATNQTLSISLLSKHTGIAGADIGKVLIRFVDATAAGHVLGIDELLVEAVGIGQTAGYANGQIWVDTVSGTAGTEPFVNGTADKAVLTWADALTLSAALGITDFHIINGSTITLSATSDNYSLFGNNWVLVLNGQQTASAHFEGADVSGVQTGSGAGFHGGEMGTTTLADDAHLDDVGLSGTITLPAGSVEFVDCHHDGATAPILDFGGAVGSTTVHLHNYHGAIEIKNMGQAGTDVLHFSSPDGKLTLDNTNVGGTKNLNGTFELVDNSTGMTTNKDGAIIEQVGVAGAGLTDLGGMSTGMKAEVNTEALDVVNVDTIPELSQAQPPVNPTMRQAQMLEYMALRNKVDVTGTLKEIHNSAGTIIAKKTLSDDDTTYSEAKMVSGA